MDSKHDEQKDKIKNQVDSNKNNTHDETKLGSQMESVNHFGVRNNKQDEEDKENIRNKIDATKKRQLQESGSSQYIPNVGNEIVTGANEGADYYGDEGDPVDGAISGASSMGNAANNLRKGAKELSSKSGKKAAEEGSKIAGKAASKGGQAASKGLQAGGKAAAKGAQTAAKGAQAAGKAAVAAGKAIVAAISKFIAFLVSVLGIPLAILVLVIFIIVLIQIIVSSYGQKYGIDSTNIEEFLREADVEKIEGLTRDEVDQMLENYVCKYTWWDIVRNFFGVPDLTNPCVIRHKIKSELELREKNGKDEDRHGRSVTVKTQDELAPGYFFATLYYAFDTQNLDEDGELYIPLVTSGHTRYNDNKEKLFTEIITDLDAITTLLNTKVDKDGDGIPETKEPIYTWEEIMELLDNYIFFEDHHNDDPAHGEGPYYDEYGYKWGYPYWLYQYIKVGVYPNGQDHYEWACVQQVPETYYTDELKFKLYLRYGENVMAEYERDKNWNLQWQKTSGQCKSWTGWTKWANGDIEENGSVSLKVPPSMDKYNKKANPDTTADDNAKVTLVSGITYGYDSGFIYNTYPRYNDDYITVPRDYGYKIDKEIERIIQTIDSRQDYTNYFLGYESDVAQYIAGINNGSYSFNGGAKCTFDIGGQEVGDIKVRLKHAHQNASIPKDLLGQFVEGEDLIDLEKYIMGVVYAEISDGSLESFKVQAVAATSWLLTSKNIINENGVNIIEISNSTWDQTYCDPDKGCDICESTNGILSLYTKGTTPTGGQCKHHFGPLSSDSDIRKAVKEVFGQVLKDSNGNIVKTGYGTYKDSEYDKPGNQKKWNDLAKSGKDYVEILRSSYGVNYVLGDPNCTYGSNGDWAEWDQGDEPWGSFQLGSGPKTTMADIGCYTTAYAMLLANLEIPLTIPNFNPGTFAQVNKQNGYYTSGGGLVWRDALANAVGGLDKLDIKDINLYGSKEYKTAQISELLESGYKVIVRVKADPDQHWVYITGINGNQVIMADPATRVTTTMMWDQYAESGVVFARGIKAK